MSRLEIRSPADLREVMQAEYEVSAEQWAAIAAPLEPAVVVAGAGSGKTSLMAARVVYLVATGQVEPGQVLGLTFTTKAASELGRRIREALIAAGILPAPGRPPAPDEVDVIEPMVATYNAYASSLLTEHGLRIGHEPDTRVLADASRYQLAARVVDRYTGRIEQLTDHPETVIQNLLSLDSAMCEHLVTPDDVRAFDATVRPRFAAELDGESRVTYLEPVLKAIGAIDRRAELLGLVESYRRLKAQLGLMDFSDQIALGARLAIEQPEVSRLEREKYAVVLLDEYQDTSVAQAKMLGLLFSGDSVESGRGHPVTAVGDPNQAIYGWRGASVSNILNYGEDFPRADGSTDVPTYPLTVNRRSDERILTVANQLAQPLYDATPQAKPLQAKPNADDGAVVVSVHEHADDELGWLADQVIATHATHGEMKWSGIGVLTRDNAHAADVFDALTRNEIPVEIVGLQGLLRLPEVAEVVATLRLLHDLTANASLLTVLTGPRWAIGPRDLAILGRRAAKIAGNSGRPERPDDVRAELAQSVEGADPIEVASLCDALEDPGDGAYSVEARERFALLSSELRFLRAYAGEPLLDLVRRIIDTTGIDIELASAVSPAAAARRDNLDLFVKAVAEFQAVDGDVTLPALLAYLSAEDELGTGLDVATPTEADSVKLLTVHRAKGLEWDAVFLVGVCETRFPTNRSRTLWTSSPAVLPSPLRGDARDLAQLHSGYDKAALDLFRAETKDHDKSEELRLGYVAFTRAKHQLSVSSYLWAARKTPYGASAYQTVVREVIEEWGEKPASWLELPPPKTPNPFAGKDMTKPWPPVGPTREAELRVASAAIVREAITAREAGKPLAEDGLDLELLAKVNDWDTEMERLLAEARADRSGAIAVPLPSSLSATSLARLRDDAGAFARDLARPMPRQPSPSARFGTRFHAWVEARFGQQQLIDPDELPGRADVGIDDEADLAELIARFEAGPFADRVPIAVEPAFALVLAGQVVRGRIDAVYAEPDGFLLIDWKTNQQQTADPLQLALYRLAWAELNRVPLAKVRAAFFYVRTGELIEPTDLSDREELESLLR
ncbi:MAG: UvrD/REP helicase [Marmoricola sp.]|nr:UvrD/REP helicase [Marmoricola sp.]